MIKTKSPQPIARPISDLCTTGRGDNPPKKISSSHEPHRGAVNHESTSPLPRFVSKNNVSADRRGSSAESTICPYPVVVRGDVGVCAPLDRSCHCRDGHADLGRRAVCRFGCAMKASSPWMASSVRPGLELGARARTATGIGGMSMLSALFGVMGGIMEASRDNDEREVYRERSWYMMTLAGFWIEPTEPLAL